MARLPRSPASRPSRVSECLTWRTRARCKDSRKSQGRRVGEGRISCLSERVLQVPRRRRLHPGTRTVGTSGERRPTNGLPARGLLLRHGYLSRIPATERPMEPECGALEAVAGRSGAAAPGEHPMTAVGGCCQDRPVLGTGATGLVGSWLTRRLREAGADVVCLVRDWVPQSELVRSRLLEQGKVMRGDVRDRETIERTPGEYET